METLARVTATTVLLGLTGCATDYAPNSIAGQPYDAGSPAADTRRQAFVANTPGLGAFTRHAILAGRLRAHMDPEQVIASWGEPQHIQHWMNWDLSGDTVEWLYGRQERDRFHTLRNVYLIDDEVWLWYVHPEARRD